jgi:hypothetical protein
MASTFYSVIPVISFVMHLSEDGYRNGQNMEEEYCIYNKRYVYMRLLVSLPFPIGLMHSHVLLKIARMAVLLMWNKGSDEEDCAWKLNLQ